jgi:hypothetical protein
MSRARFEPVDRICRRWQRRYARMHKRPRHKAKQRKRR